MSGPPVFSHLAGIFDTARDALNFAGERLLGLSGEPQPPAAATPDTGGDPPIGRKAPLTESEWMQFFDNDGHINDPATLRARVYAGGAQPAIRGALWEFLLNVHPWRSTYAEREAVQQQHAETYGRYLSIYHAMHFTRDESDMVALIAKDVHRTDRDVDFYAGDANPNLEKLARILGIFSILHRPDLPYVQGMNEFASMLLYVQGGRECDAFWCFERLLQFQGAYFQAEEKTAMNRQFHTLLQLLSDVVPPVYEHLCTHDAQDVLFAYRWLLLNFKREFAFEDSLLVQETIWSMPVSAYVDNRINLGQNPYPLFIGLAFFIIEARALQDLAYDDLLMHMNTLANKIDVSLVLRVAEYRYWLFILGKVPDDR